MSHGWAPPRQQNLDTGEVRVLVKKVAVIAGHVRDVWVPDEEVKDSPLEAPPEEDEE